MNIYTNKYILIHNQFDDCWIIINNKVYDVTSFLDKHPGGSDIILDFAGKDATEEFRDIGHSENAKKMLEKYLIGKVSNDCIRTDYSERNTAPVSNSSFGSKLMVSLFLLAIIRFLVFYLYLI